MAIRAGTEWPAPANARRPRTLRVYRFDPDRHETPQLDTCHIDADACGPMLPDALIHIKNTVDPTLTLRRSCREGICGSCAMNIDGTNWLACTCTLAETDEPINVCPLNNLPVLKDLVGDQRHAFGWWTAVTRPPESASTHSRTRSGSTAAPGLVNAPHKAVRTWLTSPGNAIAMLLVLGVGFLHLALGLQVVVEDYVHDRRLSIPLLMLVPVACGILALIGGFAVLHVTFTA